MSFGKASSLNSRSQKATGNPTIPIMSSLGSRLFIYVLGSALLGLAGLSYFFYHELVSGAKREIEQKVYTEVNGIESKLLTVNQSVLALGSATKSLKQANVKDADLYKQLVLEQFRNVGLAYAMGLAQSPNQLVPNRKFYYPYFSRGVDKDDIKYADLATLYSGNSLAEKGEFSQKISSKEPIWLEPFTFNDANTNSSIIMTSFISPLNDQAGEKIGLAIADVTLSSLSQAVKTKVLNNNGSFLILSSQGYLLASPDLSKSDTIKGYRAIPEISQIWDRIQSEPAGLIESGGDFWAFRRIPSTKWLLLAQVPQSSVLTPIFVGVLLASMSVAALLGVVVFIFVRQLNNRLKPILDECEKISEQRGEASIEDERNQDEIDQLSKSFYKLINQIARNEQKIREEVSAAVQAQERLNQARQSQAEAEFLEDEVGGLLDVVSAMEEGDLTMEAEVSDRATGLVADTLNRLREQLAEIIARVLGTTQQVVHGAEDLQKLARVVADNTVEQAQSVAQGVSLTEEVAIAAQDSATKASAANQSLLTAQSTVEEGQVAINTLTEGISVLQKGSAQIVQKMKTLGEFVGLAEQFVQDQGQIASLTQVLAINATLVAARAAEQRDPKQFIGVAREFEAIAGQVNNLANQTNEGLAILQQRTAQIQSVVSAIDSEVQSLGGLVEGFNSGVEQSQKAFYDIQKVTELVVNAGQSITESSVKIADAAETTVQYMSEIDKLATQTADLTRSTSLQAEQMGALARKLLAGIQFFRLPDSLLLSLGDTGITPRLEVQTLDIESIPNLEDFNTGDEDHG
ncbi:methyl-accepting chemotaxis protein [Synechococcus sp. PCC 7502]|uniref:methyl-accepting chemotaxis protein n=1 Tax=Synechococcus sp. PCC 7502 TaxID=1173263 RepID=UPI00029FF56E|nr:methyl-accepting chemotaxis protein [Synechococcus sp. PCC 7502]AFY73102.1 methyl-accepting chemotaxis protein [Synechococcus sp. PCC 7502]